MNDTLHESTFPWCGVMMVSPLNELDWMEHVVIFTSIQSCANAKSLRSPSSYSTAFHPTQSTTDDHL